MGFEEAIQMLLVAVGEVIRSPWQGEPGSEQVRFERRGPVVWVAGL